MKTSSLKAESGSVLLVCMIFVMTLGAALYGYLRLVQNSNLQVERAQRWNSVLPVAEGGIDEGLAKLNTTVGIDKTNVVGGFNNILSHNLSNGKYTSTYKVRFDDFGNFQRFLTATGIVTAPITGETITRTVKVGVQRQALFSKGMVAMDFINMNGHSIASDSYNSQDPSQSTNGIWNGYSGSNGDIAAVNGYVNLGNQTIKGDLYLGPDATYDNSGTITGTIYTDSNLQYNDVVLPTQDDNGNGITWNAAPTSFIKVNNKWVAIHNFTSSGYYIVSDASTPLIVDPGLNVTIDVRASSWSPSYIDINGGTTNSANVSLYLESGSITLSGNSSGGASAGRPENFAVFGLPAVTSITYSGTSTFVGVIYAPEAAMTLNGGGNNNNLIGSVVVKSVTMNGHYAFHYDTSLSLQYWGAYVVGSWQEL